MKKRLFAVLAAVLMLFALTMTVSAEGEVANTVDESVEETVETETAAEQFCNWAKENFSGIIVSLASIYAVLPKWGGLAILIRILKRVQAYFDDKNNAKSIYNMFSSQADMVSKFLNDVYPMIESVKDGDITSKELISQLKDSKQMQNMIFGMIKAFYESNRLMAEQISFIIESSPNINEKRRAEMRAERIVEEKKIDALLAEVSNGCEEESKDS